MHAILFIAATMLAPAANPVPSQIPSGQSTVLPGESAPCGCATTTGASASCGCATTTCTSGSCGCGTTAGKSASCGCAATTCGCSGCCESHTGYHFLERLKQLFHRQPECGCGACASCGSCTTATTACASCSSCATATPARTGCGCGTCTTATPARTGCGCGDTVQTGVVSGTVQTGVVPGIIQAGEAQGSMADHVQVLSSEDVHPPGEANPHQTVRIINISPPQ